MKKIGKLYTCTIQFYNNQIGKMDFKRRPFLIIGKADDGDYNVLPVSTIQDESRIDKDYDLFIDINKYPNLKLKKNCYIRVNKQNLINKADISMEISALKTEYPLFYKKCLDKWNEYNNKILNII